MKRLFTYWSVFISLLMGISCQDETESDLSSGSGFMISLIEDAEIETRSKPSELPDPILKNAWVKVVNESGNAIYDGKLPDKFIAAAPGQYTLSASYGENPVLALDAPYYEGSIEESVLLDEITPVTIPCSVANALTSVVFKKNPDSEADFDNDFESYAVKVSVDEDETHSYSVDITNDGKSAYYRANSQPTYVFVATLRDGTTYSQPLTHEKFSDPATFAAKSHCIITLSAGKIDAGLKVKVEQVAVEQVSITETIPLDRLPKPKVEGFANNQLLIVETETVTAEQASIQLKTATPLQELKMKFNFGDERYANLNNKEFYLLSDLTDKQIIETTLGIQLPEVGTTGAIIDLAPLANALLTKDGADVTNTIELDVQANNRWSSEDESANRIYTLTCTKPEFTISVDPLNCWSWEFLVNEAAITSGNAEKIKADLKYQYFDGDQWRDCQTRSGETGRLQQFTIDNSRKYVYLKDSPSERTYKVRALYRGAIASNEETVTLEEPWQLPNSDMEEWHTTKSNTGLGGYTYYTFFPNTGSSTGSWWSTNNERSQDGVKAGRLSYKGCFSPCVSYSESIRHGGNRSALLYTSGHGGGYASTGSILYPEGAFAGSLFIGNYSWQDKQETIDAGKSFTSRPKKMTFWYKYIPKNSDAFKVYVELKNGSETVATGQFVPSQSSAESNWEEATVTIDYVEQPQEVTSIFVQFLSTDKTSFSEGDFDKNKEITFPVMGDWNAHIGSMLYIDDISLIYDK